MSKNRYKVKFKEFGEGFNSTEAIVKSGLTEEEAKNLALEQAIRKIYGEYAWLEKPEHDVWHKVYYYERKNSCDLLMEKRVAFSVKFICEINP